MRIVRWPTAAPRVRRSTSRNRLRLDPLEERVVPTAEVEPNGTLATATAFAASSDTLNGSIGSVADVDFFRVNLAHGDTLTVRFNSRDDNDLGIAPAAEVLNPQGQLVGSSLDGHITTIVAPAAGTYYLRLFTGQLFGNFTGNYSIDTAVAAYAGVTESEPNDTPGTAETVGTFANFRGTLASAGDIDYYSFSGTAGRAVAIKLGNKPAANPTIRLFDPGGSLLASNLAGNGLHIVLPTTGTYRFAIQGDNSAGGVTGAYVGNVNVVASPIVDPEPGNGFAGAAAWAVNTTTSRVVGTLSSLNDVDVFAVTLSTPGAYQFRLESPTLGLSTQNRSVKLFNEFGQLVRYSVNNGLAWSGTGTSAPSDLRQRYFVTVQATNETGLGSYALSGRVTQPFPTYRDVPLYFHDYTGQTTHLGYGPAAPFGSAAMPQAVGWFESRYDIYDVDVVLTNPGGAVEHASVGVGEYDDYGGGGLGSGTWGTRRVDGDSLVDVSTGVGSGPHQFGAAAIINHELGHVSTLPHARHPIDFMAYDRQASLNTVGSFYQFPWTTQEVPTEFALNQRDHLDWVLQAGRIGLEAEPNNSFATSQNLDPWLAEMTADPAPRNDRVVVVGRIDSGNDADVYKITAAAGETFAFDIDSAEFQNPLNSALAIYNSAGTLLASSLDALDRDSGLFSVDPYVTHRFTTAGTYSIRITSEYGTAGDYRLKVTADQAFDTAGPRVLATSPDGGNSQNGNRQIVVWFNDQIDPATLTPANVVVTGATSGVRTGTATFDPLDATLIWLSDSPLPADTYTVTLKSGATGVKDPRGNALDGETSGSFTWPARSGNGSPGGDFSFSFTITGPDTSAAAVTSSSYREHPSNRGMFTLSFDDDLDIQSLYDTGLTVRGAGPDGTLGTADDTLAPADVLYNKAANSGPSNQVIVYTRGVPDAGNYRVEGTFQDAAGNTVTLSRVEVVPVSELAHGPVVADVSIQPNTSAGTGITDIDVTFGSAVNPATLTAASFVVWRSQDPTFFNGNDVQVQDADGIITWDATHRRATFKAASALATGYYLIELAGGPGGIASPGGQLLDGEFLDSNIQGNSLFSLWRDSPSGDGAPGGDYRATFSVRQANSAPVVLNVSPTLNSILEDTTNPPGQQPGTFLAASVTDADAGDPKGMAIIGVDETIGGTWQYSLDGGATWSAVGTVSPSAALLIESTDQIRFVPAANANGTVSITYYAWDQTSGITESRIDLSASSSRGGSTAFSIGSQTATLVVLPVNDAPVITGPAPVLQPVLEDATNPPGQQPGTFLAGSVTDPDVGDPTGMAVIGLGNAEGGTWQYSLDGTTWTAFGPVSLSAARLVRATDFVRFVPAPNANGTATITYRAWDQTSGTGGEVVDLSAAGSTGGTTAFSSAGQTANLPITPVNDPPSFTKGPDQTTLEDSGPRTMVGWATNILPGPANESGQTLTFEVTTDNPGLFSAGPAVSPTGTLTYTPAPDANGLAVVTVRLKDNGGTANGGQDTSPPQTFTITVTPVNDAPRFTKGGNIRLMQENPGPQTVVGWATNIQPGPPNESAQSVAFEIVGNTNPGLFTVAPAVGPTGTLTFVPAPGVHGYSTISVRLKDDGGTANGGQDTSATQSFWIGINPINQAPNFVVGPDQTVPEDAGFQSIPWATGVSAGSPFEADQQLTFEVVSNTNPGLFISGPSVSPAGALLFAPADNLFGSATIIIRLHDDGGTLFGGQDTSAEQSFTITVLSVNDAPSFAVGADRSIAEDAGPHAVSGWATSILAGPANESGQAVTFEVVSNSNPGLFGAGPAVAPDGTLTFMPAPNAFGSATIEIRARDDGGTANGGQDASGSQTFHITVTPVNDAPEFVKGPDPTAREDAGPVSVSGWATGIHPGPTNENSQNVTFEVTGNSHPELFSVTPAVAPDGTLTFTPAADEFGSATITLRLCDDGGTANSGQDTSAEQTFTITVTAVNDAPAFIKGADQTVAEDSGARTVPAWATGLSIGPVNEAGQQLTFEVIGNTRPGLFAAGPTVNAHGTLTFTAAADAFGTATITIQARDDGGTADGGVDVSPAQSFTITVAPVNDAPVAGPDAATTTAGRPSRIPVLANDSDADGDTLTIISFTAPAKGSVRRQGGTLVYTPRNGTSGLDAFAYTVSDGHGGTASANVSVTVKDLTAPKATAIRLYYGDGRSFDVRSATRTVLPWELIRKVEVVFSEEVAVQADSLTVTGLAGAVDMTFAYDPATRTATWAPTAGLGNGRFTFRLARDGVADGSGNLLAADWARSVGLLAGDFNGDGAVSDSDLTAIRRRLGTANRFADIDGNGLVTQADLDLATANRGKRLP